MVAGVNCGLEAASARVAWRDGQQGEGETTVPMQRVFNAVLGHEQLADCCIDATAVLSTPFCACLCLCLFCACTQVGVFSATLPPEALEITRKFMNKPVSQGENETGGKRDRGTDKDVCIGGMAEPGDLTGEGWLAGGQQGGGRQVERQAASHRQAADDPSVGGCSHALLLCCAHLCCLHPSPLPTHPTKPPAIFFMFRCAFW